jgi:putative Ca2+/H+ antiporter (TMEM165/GDT1 family)
VPAVLFGDKLVRWVPMRWVHRVAALVFATLGVLVLIGVGLS